jgi:hypothetical protein
MREPNEREAAAILEADVAAQAERRSPILTRKTGRREDPHRIDLDGLHWIVYVIVAVLSVCGFMFYGWTHR